MGEGQETGRDSRPDSRPEMWIEAFASKAERRFPRLWRTILRPAQDIVPRVLTDRLGVEAGSMTYGAFLAIPPLLLLLVVGASLFVSAADLQTKVVEVVNGFVPGLSEALPTHLKLDSAGQLSAGLIGVAGLMWTASGFAARVKTSLGVVFRTRPTGLTIGRFSAALVGVPVFVTVFALAALSGVANWFGVTGILGSVVRIIIDLGMFLVSVCFFLVVYWLLTPDRALGVREHLPGAVAFAIAWAVLQRFGSIYVSAVITRTTALYGTIGAIFGLLAFLYVSMWLFLLGAELSQTLRERRPERGAAKPA